jgi:hypothetical protein
MPRPYSGLTTDLPAINLGGISHRTPPWPDIGPIFYAPFLDQIGSEVTLLTNRAILQHDGTPAYRSDIRWTTPIGIPMTSIFVTAFREGKESAIVVSSWSDIPIYAPIAESLTFP